MTNEMTGRPGEWILCDIFGRVLRRQMQSPTNGLGLIYRCDERGIARRVFGL